MIFLQGIGQAYYEAVKDKTTAFTNSYYGFLTSLFGR